MQSQVRALGKAGMVASIGLLFLAGQLAHAAEKIGVSMPNIKGPWFTPVLYGISDEAKKLGYDVVIQDAGGYGNVDKQVSQFQNLVVQKVAAILIDPANPASFNGAVRQAKAAKIPMRRHRRATAISVTNWPRAPGRCCRTGARSPYWLGPPVRSGHPTGFAASRKTSQAPI
jgi:hypothetical protein